MSGDATHAVARESNKVAAADLCMNTQSNATAMQPVNPAVDADNQGY